MTTITMGGAMAGVGVGAGSEAGSETGLEAGAGSALALDELTVELETDAGLLRAIDGLRLAIERGETFALVGESGCGKSMTALALLRLLPENGRVTGGSVRLDGRDLLDLPEREMRPLRGGRIAMIFQEPATSLNPVMRVGDQLREAIETHTPLRGAAARAKAIDWLRRVGIPEPERRIDDYPFRMSGGQKQRVMIAMALAAEPDFLIADEPTTALDVTIQAQILELLQQLQREQGLGLLLITHDLAVVRGMAQQVALMYSGEIVEQASAEAFFAQPRHPYARLLLAALPDARKRGEALAAIPGTVPPLTQRFEGCRFAPRCAQARPDCARRPPPLRHFGLHWSRCVLEAPVQKVDLLIEPVPAADVSPASRREAALPASTGAAAAPLLDVRGLNVHFERGGGWFGGPRQSFHAVRDLDLSLAAGETLALVGESGCGKTTTGKALAQLLRGQARLSGQALFDRQDLFTLQGEALRRARRDVQIIFQDPFASLNPRLRVGEILEEGLEALRPDLDAAARRERVLGLCGRVGLGAEALGRYPHEFSGGQRQRIAIARALAVQPRLIVCDEPTSALDVSVQAQILNLLRELQRETGVALLFITHNIAVVEYVAQRIAVMHQGCIVEIGPVETVLAMPQQAYTRSLLAAVPRL
jgi:peptide/nickel transport system ATP-binding protein